MRKATHNYGFIVDNDKFIGIALGYDYCAEHEWGIDSLKSLCGIPMASRKNLGVSNRTITKVPPIVFKEEIYKERKMALLYTGRIWRTKEENDNYTPHDLMNWKEDLIWNENQNKNWNKQHPNSKVDEDNIISAWDDSGFGVAVMGDKEVEWLKELKTAIEEKRLTIAIANYKIKNPFAGSSLCLMITDRIPKEAADAMYYADKEYFDREKYEKKIGMKKIIEKYGNKNGYQGLHYFLACSPKWIDYNNKRGELEELKKKYNTKYDIVYWINYSDDDNNYGWYSVEEIREWLTGNKKLTEIRKR
jgi:hypothetical protein